MKISTYCPCCFSFDIEKSDAILMPFMAKKIFDYDYVNIDQNWNLFNFDSGKGYLLCKSVKCDSCNFLFSDFRFDDDEMFELYKDYREESYLDLRESFEPGYKLRNEYFKTEFEHKLPFVEDFLSTYVNSESNVLDWGGDDGKSTPFKNQVKNIFIYDITEKQLEGNIKHIDSEKLLESNFDLIVCSNVLEHVSFPVDFVKNIKNCMSSQTVLYIEVPFEKLMDSTQDVLSKKRHWHEHINFYSELSLKNMIENSGLEIIKFDVLDYSFALNYSNFGKIFMIACKINIGDKNESM
jgi:2-polyprenyl-3-methyl-5-hydroxy-6-metoxy-1,4-benzoquinol methylase